MDLKLESRGEVVRIFGLSGRGSTWLTNNIERERERGADGSIAVLPVEANHILDVARFDGLEVLVVDKVAAPTTDAFAATLT